MVCTGPLSYVGPGAFPRPLDGLPTQGGSVSATGVNVLPDFSCYRTPTTESE